MKSTFSSLEACSHAPELGPLIQLNLAILIEIEIFHHLSSGLFCVVTDERSKG